MEEWKNGRMEEWSRRVGHRADLPSLQRQARWPALLVNEGNGNDGIMGLKEKENGQSLWFLFHHYSNIPTFLNFFIDRFSRIFI